MSSCEMCGKNAHVVTVDVERVELKVCNVCASFGKVKQRSYNAGFQRRHYVRSEGPEFMVVSDFSQLLRKARDGKGMNQEDFAKFLNERVSILEKWEKGALKPTVDTAQRVGKILGVTLVQKEEADDASVPHEKRKNDELTLGDLIKLRRRG